jgi:hypothetical protein
VESEVQAFAFVMTIIVSSVCALTVIGLAARYLWRLGSQAKPAALSSAEDGARLQRLEHAVESIAIEVERISEGQRFTVALLSERLPRGERPDSLGAGPKRVITPH